jgi:hypothetical protein
MSRWILPGSFEARFREQEAQRRFDGIERIMEERRLEAERRRQVPVIEDHDRGDEDVPHG